jgi:hypothetical protein
MPGDEVLVIGATAKSGISADEVFGGTRAEFRKTLEERRDLAETGRRIGLLLSGLGLLLLGVWAAPRVNGRLRGYRAPLEARPTNLGRRITGAFSPPPSAAGAAR